MGKKIMPSNPKQFWNDMSPAERLDFIIEAESLSGETIGHSNSKATYNTLSTKVVNAINNYLSPKAVKVVKSKATPVKIISAGDMDKMISKAIKATVKKSTPKSVKVAKTIEVETVTSEIEVPVEESLDLLIVFDDTGSMSSVRKQVRQKIDELTSTLFKDIKKLRMSVFIQNDYCDAPKELMIQDFTENLNTIKTFVNSNSPCGGGDSDECYELSLNRARSLNWQSPNRALVIIADANPHEVGYRYGGKTYDLDWRKECVALKEIGVKIYSVQALGSRHSSAFYEQIARITGGIKLDLSQFAHVETYIKAIAYRQSGQLETYRTSDPSFNTNIALKSMFNRLAGGSGVSTDKIELLSKFQVMNVDTDGETSIRDFVEMNGCSFQRGKGYYQLIPRTSDGKANSEIIQADKEVIFVDRSTGETFDDTNWCREQLGIPYGIKATCRPLAIPDVMNKYDIFIQSNSYNRKLDSGCKFLYELDHR
jgi:hypothetical protein